MHGKGTASAIFFEKRKLYRYVYTCMYVMSAVSKLNKEKSFGRLFTRLHFKSYIACDYLHVGSLFPLPVEFRFRSVFFQVVASSSWASSWSKHLRPYHQTSWRKRMEKGKSKVGSLLMINYRWGSIRSSRIHW